ncbi:MAG: AMP-binding protein [Acidobacteriota bacterium]|nr:AMP-binding protein [Blastocatellia bacterium]MDW8238116.1 AMP-binding protein [Acidobacteriota bacterium]
MTERVGFDHAVAWRPDDETRARAQLTRFISLCGLDSFDALYRRSIEDVGWFTQRVLQFLGIQFDTPYRQIVDLSRGIQWPQWCVGGQLNITKSCLTPSAIHHMTANVPAVIWEGEEGARRTMSYAELNADVERCAAGLRALGLGRGDAVGIHLPMIPETVVALLAVGRIGGIAVPLFSGYGPAAIQSRLQDVGAKALFTCDAFPRRGRPVMAKAVADEAAMQCHELLNVIVVSRLGVEVPMYPGRDLTWEALLQAGEQADVSLRRVEATAAEDPLIVLYTSGTTGRPKGILHSHCGFPIKSAQDMAFGTDVGPGSRISWVTDIGWMMGPWLIYGATLLGATIVLYDGAPDYPEPDRLWAFCAAHQVEILGISPTLVRALAAHGDQWPARHDLSRLRILGSTGEPWNPDPWWWLFEKVGGGRIPIINYSGGTEISGGILMGNPLLPIKPCSFPAPCPGIAADVLNEQGESVRGAVGELVIRQPWIGMARGFWKDPDRYLQTYWSRWPDIWVHGDWAQIDSDGHWYILGRSDDTLKVAGKRVGPAEVESILVAHPSVAEAAVIGIPDEVKGSAMIAFCVPVAGAPTGPDVAEQLRERVGEQLGKPLRPEQVHFVSALPRTRNAKVMRRVIRAAYLNEDPGDITALENPSAVEAIRQLGSAINRQQIG